MKKLMFLTALLGTMTSMLGCRCLDRLCRGAPAEPCGVPAYAAAPYAAAPCAPACGAVDACGGAPGGMIPGPEAYAPGPTP